MKKLYFLIFMILTFLRGKSSTTIPPTSLKFRLPRDIKPLNYDLEIFTDLNNDWSMFWGTVCITITCDKSTDRITLHQNGLKIENVEQIKQLPVLSDPPSIIRVQNRKYASKSDQYTIILEKSMEKDTNYEMELEFSGSFHLNAKGYVSLKYVKSYLTSTRLAFTRMDKIGARYIFPCFDEMGMKATFKMRIGHPSIMKGFSNANLSLTKPVSFPPNWVVDEFKETVLMEASALAIILIPPDFESLVLLHESSNTEIRTLADSSVIYEIEHFSVLLFRIFDLFLSYFKVEYAFKKFDVFVLRNFKSTAISSFGVIYTSETTILAALQKPTSSLGYEMVSELCNVMSKQWIGYMATMSDYNDNYLHTALNLFIQTMCVAEIGSTINPKWEITFLELSFLNTFVNLHQIFAPVSQIGGGSDLVYQYTDNKLAKAYLFYRSIHTILGNTLFQKCIFNYLMKFKFTNSNRNDLWDAFTNTANEVKPYVLAKHNLSVGDIAESWINQTGYPLITVIRNDDTKEISISQGPFYSFGEDKQEDMPKRCWIIPVSYTTKSESRSEDITMRDWLTCKGPLVLTNDIPRDDWILFDMKFSTIGRINYDEPNWILIVKSLVNEDDPTVFNRLTRARLTSDMFALAEVGELSYKIVLDAMKYLPRELYYENFQLALCGFNKIWSLLIGTSIYKSFQKYIRRLLDPVFNRDEFKNLTDFRTDTNLEFKTAIIESSCKFGVVACRRQSQKIIKEWINDKIILAVPERVYNTIHCQGVKHGNGNYWDFLWNFSKGIQDVEKRRQIFRALACSTNVRILERFLAWSINGEKIAAKDSVVIFRSLLSNRKGYRLGKMFFTDHYDEILKFHKDEVHFLLYWIELLDATVRREDLHQLKELADSKQINFISTTSRLYDSYKNAQKNILWFERSEETFDKYFSKGIFSMRWIKF